ncbi:MAG TPA: histidine phosphatase family protein, partial [Acidimicrobiales bacterium]|nr:histidine phosphatase family protein [Acidimicrobiales bacterium]
MNSASTTILFVRHGTTATTGSVLPGRAPGLHLSARGIEQATSLAERLCELTPQP